MKSEFVRKLFVSALLACGAVMGRAAGETISNGYPRLCAFVPDAEMTIGKSSEGNYFGSRYSAGTLYSQDCNSYFTVDVSLPGTFNVSGGFTPGNSVHIDGSFAQWRDLTEAQCGNATVSQLIYKRSVAGGIATGWSLIESRKVSGIWVPSVETGYPSYCAFAPALHVNAPSQSYVTDHYRVMIQPKLYGAPAQAGVWWGRP